MSSKYLLITPSICFENPGNYIFLTTHRAPYVAEGHQMWLKATTCGQRPHMWPKATICGRRPHALCRSQNKAHVVGRNSSYINTINPYKLFRELFQKKKVPNFRPGLKQAKIHLCSTQFRLRFRSRSRSRSGSGSGSKSRSKSRYRSHSRSWTRSDWSGPVRSPCQVRSHPARREAHT